MAWSAILQYFGVSGVIGALLGAWLFGSDQGGGKNIFGQVSWHPVAGGIVGGLALWAITTIFLILF